MLIERLLKLALLGSEWVLYLLIALSVVSFSAIVERVWFFQRRKDNLDLLRSDLVKQLEAGNVDAAGRRLEQSRAIEARVAKEALRWAHAGPEAINDAVESELARLKKELERGTNLLGTLGNNAPFIGLFGTVLGVIIAFDSLGAAGQNSAAMGGVMAGIAEALVATGVGLFVAIPAVVAYNAIQKRIAEIETDAISLTKLIAAYTRSRASGAGLPISNFLAPANSTDLTVASDHTVAAKATDPDSEEDRSPEPTATLA